MRGINPVLSRYLRLLEIKHELDLITVLFEGHPFTWMKHSLSENNTYEWLDFLIHSSLINVFPNIVTKHHSFTISDHCSISFGLGSTNQKPKSPFCFEMARPEKEDYNILVKKNWAFKIQGSHIFKLVSILKLLKKITKIWRKKSLGNVSEQLKEADK